MQKTTDLGPLFTISEQELTRPARRREDRDVMVLRVELDAQRREVARLRRRLGVDGVARQPPPRATEVEGERVLLTAKELRAALGISTATLWRWGREGHFPQKIVLGKMVRWRKDEVDAWLKAKSQRPAAPDVPPSAPRRGRPRGR